MVQYRGDLLFEELSLPSQPLIFPFFVCLVFRRWRRLFCSINCCTRLILHKHTHTDTKLQ